MLDLHAHVLPGIDDGPRTLEESVALVEAFIDDGVDHIVATPHIYPGVFDNGWDSIARAYNQLAEELDRRQLAIGMSFAAEVRISGEMIDRLTSGDLPVYAGKETGTSAMLVEFPDGVVPLGVEAAMQQLLRCGVTPVIAHPERNRAIMQSPDKAGALARMGCRLQVTSGSVLGEFGERAQTTAVALLDAGWVSVLASDAHNLRSRPPRLSAARQWLVREYGQALADELTLHAPHALAGGYLGLAGRGGFMIRELPRRFRPQAESRKSGSEPKLRLVEFPSTADASAVPSDGLGGAPDRQWPAAESSVVVRAADPNGFAGNEGNATAAPEWQLPQFVRERRNVASRLPQDQWTRAFEDTMPVRADDASPADEAFTRDQLPSENLGDEWRLDANGKAPEFPSPAHELAPGQDVHASGDAVQPASMTSALEESATLSGTQSALEGPSAPSEEAPPSKGAEPSLTSASHALVPVAAEPPKWVAYSLDDLPILSTTQRLHPGLETAPEEVQGGSKLSGLRQWWARLTGKSATTRAKAPAVLPVEAEKLPSGPEGLLVIGTNALIAEGEATPDGQSMGSTSASPAAAADTAEACSNKPVATAVRSESKYSSAEAH